EGPCSLSGVSPCRRRPCVRYAHAGAKALKTSHQLSKPVNSGPPGAADSAAGEAERGGREVTPAPGGSLPERPGCRQDSRLETPKYRRNAATMPTASLASFTHPHRPMSFAGTSSSQPSLAATRPCSPARSARVVAKGITLGEENAIESPDWRWARGGG